MLPKRNRLKKKKDFEQVFKKGQFFREDFLTLKIVLNGLKNSRFGFIVSKKVSKKAVTRNKIKRWLRVAILLQIKMGGITQKPSDIIIIIKPGVEIKNFQEIKETINRILKNSNSDLI